jgi:hypothetical protein
MSDFLASLAARALGVAEGVRPRPVSRFETSQAGEALEGEFETLARPVSGALGDTQVEARAAERGHKAAASSFSGAIERTDNQGEQDNVQRPEPPIEGSQPEPAVAFDMLETPPANEFRETIAAPPGVRVEQTAPQYKAKPRADESPETPARPAAAPQTEARAAKARPVRATATVKYEAAPETAGDMLAAPDAETVRVTIGRVDVKAVFTQPGTKRSAEPPPAGPVLSLDEYLKRRGGGRR